MEQLRLTIIDFERQMGIIDENGNYFFFSLFSATKLRPIQGRRTFFFTIHSRRGIRIIIFLEQGWNESLRRRFSLIVKSVLLKDFLLSCSADSRSLYIASGSSWSMVDEDEIWLNCLPVSFIVRHAAHNEHRRWQFDVIEFHLSWGKKVRRLPMRLSIEKL